MLLVRHAVEGLRSGRLGQQVVVLALLDDAAVLGHDDAVGVADRRQPVRDDERRPSSNSVFSARWMITSVCVSTFAVASYRG